jgi:hypothetical protein
MAQVLPMGSDVVFGMPAARLSQIGSPRGATLATDPRVSALAHCLGNVVAALGVFAGGHLPGVPGGYLGGRKPTGLAVGVTRPASNTSTPRAVVCVSWPSQRAAARYAAVLRQALSRGVSLYLNERYSTLLTHATETAIGGSQHVAEWQADTPQNAQLVFQMFINADLPALDCPRLGSAAARAGCP